MGMLDSVLELIAPTRCAGCELPGALLCEQCDEELPRIDASRACSRCGAPWGALICTECFSVEYAFEAAISVGELDGAMARAIVLHKDGGERRLGELLGNLVGQRVAAAWPAWADAVTWIPPSRVAIKRRGFDHGRALAEPVGHVSAAPVEALLGRPRAWDQRQLGRSARLARARGSFEVVAHPPERVLIVDDVMTTGATLDAAAAALLTAGASQVRVAVVGRAW